MSLLAIYPRLSPLVFAVCLSSLLGQRVLFLSLLN